METIESGLAHGTHFLFADDAALARYGARLDRHSGSRTLPLWGESFKLGCGTIEGPRLMPLSLAVVATDKDVYREADDVATIVVVDPAHPDGEVDVAITCAGRPFRRWRVHLDWNGMAVQRVADLVAGEYQVSCGAARTKFQVAGYSLAAMSARVADAVVKDGVLSATMDLSSLARPVSGRVRVTIREDGRPVYGPVELESLDGVLTASFPLTGEGPFVAHVTGIDDPGLDTQVPLRGTAKSDREEVWLARLGLEWAASALKSEGAAACRGLWIREAGRNNAPVQVDEVVAEVGRLHARVAIEHAFLTVLHPGEGRVRHVPLGTVAPRTPVEIGVQPPFSVALLGGFVGGKPWEGMACFMPPSELGLALEAPERAEPRGELAITVRTARPRGEASVFVVVRDARLTPADHPLVGLGTGLKTSLKVIDGARPRLDLAHLPDGAVPHYPKLGDRLVATGLITRDQLDHALGRQQASGKSLGQCLIEMRLVTERDVVDAAAHGLRVPFIDLSDFIIDPAIAKLVPEHIAQRHQLIPIQKVGNKLTVAIVNPINVLALDDVQLMTGLQVKAVIATPTDVQRALQDLYGAHSRLDRVFCDLSSDVGTFGDVDASGDLGGSGELCENDAPIIKLVNLVISNAVKADCGAVRIEPGAVYFDGRLEMSPPAASHPAVITRLRVLAGMDICAPGEGCLRLKVGDRTVEMRVRMEGTVRDGRAELVLRGDGPAGPVRERFPEVIYAGLVHVRGEATLTLSLGDALGRLEVDAFALHRGDWEGASRAVEVARETYGELTLPDLVHASDAVTGRLDVGWSRGPVSVELTRDGAPVALANRDGTPFAPADGPGHATLAFPAGPGRWECIVRDAARQDRTVREIAQPGVFRGLARRVRVMMPGESISADAAGALFLRVLPGADLPLKEIAQVTAGYEHLCCEQTAAKIMAAVTAWLASTDPAEKARLEGIVHAGVERERRMWVRGAGLKMYPDTAGISAYWGPRAVEHFLVMEATTVSVRLPKELDAATRALGEIARNLAGPMGLALEPKTIASTADAYRAAVHGSIGTDAIIREVSARAGVANSRAEARGAHGEVLRRVEACHAAAALLRVGSNDTLRLALALVDAIGSERRAHGAYYSTHDSAAAIAMFAELARLSLLGLTATSHARVDGTLCTVKDAAARAGEVSRVDALGGPVLVEVAAIQTEDWTAFRSNAPVSVRLKRARTGALEPGEPLALELELEQYKEGDLAHVCLPPALARPAGGGRVQSFSADFAGKNRLEVPLTVVDAGPAASPKQHWFACLRNMFDEERVGNPGVMELALR